MNLSEKTQEIFLEIASDGTKLGDLRTIAKGIKKDHAIALELWSTEKLYPRLLAILIMDTKKLGSDFINFLIEGVQKHQYDEQIQIMDWLMANQLTKDKKTIALIQSWQNNFSSLKRRIFWYYQARLRWTGQTPPNNTKELLMRIEENILSEVPEVQWAMNFAAGWIGVFDQSFRNHCIQMGEKIGLYKDEIVMRNCSPNYLPKFIKIEVEKRKL